MQGTSLVPMVPYENLSGVSCEFSESGHDARLQMESPVVFNILLS